LFSGFIIGTEALIGALIIFLFYSIIAGRSFCSWVCPINIISDFALLLRKKFKIDSNYITFNRKTRYLMLILGLILSIITSVAAFELINPITIIYRSIIFGFSFGWTVIFLILFFDLFVMRNGWCGHLCPLGGFYSLISKIHIIKVYHKVDNCTSCGICFDVCPEVQVLKIIGVNSGFVSSGECTNCGRCVEKCKDDALKFSINKFSYK
jgi:ferredoxin-type protein NapH